MPSHDELLHRADAPACPTDAEVEAALKARIAELEARAEKAEALWAEALEAVGQEHAIVETLSAELARLRAEGTFNEGIEAGAAFIEANAVLHGDTIEFRPRTEGDRNGLAYAEGIRSLRRPETGGA